MAVDSAVLQLDRMAADSGSATRLAFRERASEIAEELRRHLGDTEQSKEG